jgi:hypothetical protein
MNKLKFLKLLLTNRRFWVDLRRVLEYAVGSYGPQRGDGAADVIIFMSHYGNDLFDNKFRERTSQIRENIEVMQEAKLREKRVEWTVALQKYWRDKGVDIPK